MVKADTGSTTLDRLETSRARLDRKRALRGAAWAALGAVLVFGLLRIAGRLGIPSALADSMGSSLVLSLGVLLTGVAVVLASIHRRQATLATAARMADVRFDLDERLGTALECGLATGASSDQPVVRALLADAAARSASVDPVALVPLRVPRSAWYALALALAFAALEMVPGSPGLPTAPTAASPPALAPSSALEILETAALLREEAERQSDEYLWVVAEAMEKLAGELAAEQMSGEEAARELSRLLDHVEHATQAAVARAESTESTGSDPSQQATRSGSQGEPPSPQAAEERAQAVEDGVGLSEELQTALQDLRSELNELPVNASAEKVGTSDSTDPARDLDIDEQQFDSPDSIAPERLASLRLGPRGLGMSDAPNGAGSPQDGSGGRSIAPTDELEEIPDARTTQDFVLPSNREEGGASRRVSDEFTPETRLTTVAEAALRDGTWRKVQEAHVSSEPLGITYREVASRYFLYLAQQAEARAASQ